MQQETYVVGVDYRALSGRALVVRVSDGEEFGTAVHEYPHAVMDATLAAGAYTSVADAYDGLFAEYQLLHDYFGRGANDVMKRLKSMRREALA